MATKKAVAEKKSTALIPWDERFAKSAKAGVASVANVGAGFKQIKLDRGTITVGEDLIKNGVLECVILGFTGLKRWNKDAYDANNPKAPDCYAFSNKMEDPKAVPHPAAPDKQSTECATCDWNAYGTATVGGGKACGDTARLGILIGADLKNGKSAAQAEMYTASISPTNQKYLKTYVDYLSKLPPKGRSMWNVITQISTFPDPKTQIRVEFKLIDTIGDNDILESLYARVGEEEREEDGETVIVPVELLKQLQKPFPVITEKPAAKGKAATTGKNQKFAAKKGAAARR